MIAGVKYVGLGGREALDPGWPGREAGTRQRFCGYGVLAIFAERCGASGSGRCQHGQDGKSGDGLPLDDRSAVVRRRRSERGTRASRRRYPLVPLLRAFASVPKSS